MIDKKITVRISIGVENHLFSFFDYEQALIFAETFVDSYKATRHYPDDYKDKIEVIVNTELIKESEEEF